jgi:hypothetical protein
MKLGMLFSFGAGFLAAMILGLRPRPAGECLVGDMGSVLNTRTGDTLEKTFGAWVHQARQCHVGDYLVIAPATTGQPDIIVSRTSKTGQTSYFRASGAQTSIIDDGRVLYEWDRTEKMITYSAYDDSRKSWIENYDLNADGNIEVRTIESGSDGKIKEVPASKRWLPLVSQSGRSGTVLNERFVTIDEARAALAAAAPLQTSGR